MPRCRSGRGGCAGCRRRTGSATSRPGPRRTPCRPRPRRTRGRPARRRPVGTAPAPRRRSRRSPGWATRPPGPADAGPRSAASHDASGRGSDRRSDGIGTDDHLEGGHQVGRAGGPSGPWSTGSASPAGAGRPTGPGRATASSPTGRRPTTGSAGTRRRRSRWRAAPCPRRWPPRCPPDEPPAVCSRFHGLQRGPEQRVLGVRLPSELRGVRLADHHAPGRHQAGHQGRVLGRRRTVGIGGRTVGGHVARGVLQVLHPEGDAGQRSRVLPRRHLGVHRVGRGPGPSLVDGHEGVDGGVVGRDGRQRMVDQLGCRTGPRSGPVPPGRPPIPCGSP